MYSYAHTHTYKSAHTECLIQILVHTKKNYGKYEYSMSCNRQVNTFLTHFHCDVYTATYKRMSNILQK